MDCFIAGDRTPGSPKRAEMLAGAYPALDRPMILFQDVIEILHRSMPAILRQSLLGFEPHDGRGITGVLNRLSGRKLLQASTVEQSRASSM
jgi:hypothetical protein